MHATEQPTTEFKITTVCIVPDPAERQRRLAQVYGLIMDFGRQKMLRATIFDQPLAELGEHGRERKRGPDGPLTG
jgi:hypothetical protein